MYIPLPDNSLKLNEPVPVNIWDPSGMLLLRKGELIRDEQHRIYLTQHNAVVEEKEFQAWTLRYNREIDRMVRGNNSLERIAGVTRPMGVEAEREAEALPVTQVWVDLHAVLSTLLHRNVQAQDFITRLVQLEQRVDRVLQARVDDSLLVLVQLLFDRSMGYSATHALLCSVMCRLVGKAAGLPEAELAALCRAALTMNIGMARLQDELARQSQPLSEEQRRAVQQHPVQGVTLLRQLDVGDPVWLQLVADHHEHPPGQGYPQGKRETSTASQLLHMADVYVARISPRLLRAGVGAPQAARDVYLGPDGQPTVLGAAFVKTLGLYVPGSYVRLANDEVGVVVRRGRRVTAPLVFSIIGRSGMPLGEPALRDTSERRFEVKGSVAAEEVKVRFNVTKLLSRL